MRVQRDKKGGLTFIYKGDLLDSVLKCERELHKMRQSEQRMHLRWAYEKAKKEHENYERRINELERFIVLAREELGNKDAGQES